MDNTLHMLTMEEVSTHSIRYRILKGAVGTLRKGILSSFNPFDPIQDTESALLMMRQPKKNCFNPFDPIQDTESCP